MTEVNSIRNNKLGFLEIANIENDVVVKKGAQKFQA